MCATPHAAAEVLALLYAAHVQPARDFTIRPILSATPPLIFTMVAELTATQVTKIRALADTTVTG
jgi:hypothetical protein